MYTILSSQTVYLTCKAVKQTQSEFVDNGCFNQRPFSNLCSNVFGTLQFNKAQEHLLVSARNAQEIINKSKLGENIYKSFVITPKWQCDIVYEIVASDVGAARSSSSQTNEMDFDFFLNGGTIEERTERSSTCLELRSFFRKLCGHGIQKLVEELLQFLSWPKLTSEDYKSGFRNTRSCVDTIDEKVQENCLYIDMFPANKLIGTLDGVVENRTFFLRNTEDIK